MSGMSDPHADKFLEPFESGGPCMEAMLADSFVQADEVDKRFAVMLAENAILREQLADKARRVAELEAALRWLYDAVNLHENPTPAMATIERIMGWTKEDAQMAYEAHLARQKGAE